MIMWQIRLELLIGVDTQIHRQHGEIRLGGCSQIDEAAGIYDALLWIPAALDCDEPVPPVPVVVLAKPKLGNRSYL